jgi:hypothetical protein
MRETDEPRRLKLAGFACLALAVPALVVAGERLTAREWLAGAGAGRIAGWAGVWLTGANLLAAGLILLLAGLAAVPVLTNGRARRGALVKLAGANLLAVCMAVVGIEDAGALPPAANHPWILLPALVAFVVVARQGILLVRTGWKYEATSADEVLRRDPRPPVVYLRSFRNDAEVVVATRGAMARATRALNYLAAISPEQELAMLLARVGPVVAIGRPGEPLPELGAARLYVGDDAWHETVTSLIGRASLVLIRAGTTENLWWEVERALSLAPRQRLLFVSLGAGDDTEIFDRKFATRFGAPLAPPPPARSWLTVASQWLYPSLRSGGRILYFDAGDRAHEQPIRFTLTLAGAALAPVCPYRDSLTAAMKGVFAALGLPWARRRSQTFAVLLALFGGVLGLHHFYVGHRRRGAWYLACSWLLVPLVLGWIDAVRFALLDPPDFTRRYLSDPTRHA